MRGSYWEHAAIWGRTDIDEGEKRTKGSRQGQAAIEKIIDLDSLLEEADISESKHEKTAR